MQGNEALGLGCLVIASFPQWALWSRDEQRGGLEERVLQRATRGCWHPGLPHSALTFATQMRKLKSLVPESIAHEGWG